LLNNDLCQHLIQVPNNNKPKRNKREVPAKQKKPKPPIRSKTPSSKPRKHAGLLSGVGGALGSAFGPSGSVIGSAAGDLLGDLFGWGDYDSVAPINYNLVNNTTVGLETPLASQIPMMHTEDGSCRIRKREFIADVQMNPTFTTLAYGLNPALVTTFPWLSTVASNFEQYKFLGLTFGFRSLTANALGLAGNPGMGSVTLLTQYDIYDAAVVNKTTANNALYATSCKPAESMLHPVECDPEQTPSQPLYTGVNEVPVTTTLDRDLRLNYLGFTTLATTGGPPAVYNCGELWVTYDVMLYKPMVHSGGIPPSSVNILESFQRDEARRRKERPEEKSDSYIDVSALTPRRF
jgi:hypothetical protein